MQHHVTSCRVLPLVAGDRLHQRMRVQPEEATEHAPDDVGEETEDGGYAQKEGYPLVVGELGRLANVR